MRTEKSPLAVEYTVAHQGIPWKSRQAVSLLP